MPSGESIVTMYEKRPATDIHQETGLPLCRIYKQLRQAGVEIQPRGRRPELISPGIELLEAQVKQGVSQMSLANQYGVSKRTIQRWLGK